MNDPLTAVYNERNMCIAYMAKMLVAIGYDCGIKNRDDEWPIVFLEGPEQYGKESYNVYYQNNYKDNNAGTIRGIYYLSPIDNDLSHYNWYFHNGGYLKRQSHLPFITGYLHHIIAARIWGDYPISGYEIDHIDRNPANNSRDNLRLSTSYGNSLNQEKAGKAVRFHHGKWWFIFNNKQKGGFLSKENALSFGQKIILSARKKAHEDGHYIYPQQLVKQMSWHIPQRELPLFSFLGDYEKDWDGHTTASKYDGMQHVWFGDFRQQGESGVW